MDKFGFIRAAACSPEIKPADINFNVSKIIESIKDCLAKNVELICFPELCITGYTCADLFDQTLLISKVIPAIKQIAGIFRAHNNVIILGAPIRIAGGLYNCAVVVQAGEIKGIVPKTFLPDYGEYYEKRWFKSSKELPTKIYLDQDEQGNSIEYPVGTDLIFDCAGIKFGIEICEDLWVANPPSGKLSTSGAELIFNLSATNELIGKHKYLLDLIKNQSARCRCAYIYSSAGTGESSTDLAFSGNGIICENGNLIAETARFELGSKKAIADIDAENLRHDRQHYNTFTEESHSDVRIINLQLTVEDCYRNSLQFRKINPNPFMDSIDLLSRCEEISSIQAWGLAIRLRAINCSKAIIGISGGLDSTLALLVTVKAFDMLGLSRKGVIGITMPGFGTTNRTKSNAELLMELLGITSMQISIAESVALHFKEIGHDAEVRDVTYENSQARERTQILMDIANQENAIVIGTGDLSELALGWCTYNGDQMSMYGVNSSIPKTLVKHLVEGYARNAEKDGESALSKVLRDIIDTPISPELLPPDSKGKIEQKTEDLVGPYELHDFFLYQMLRYGTEPKKILTLASIAFAGNYDESTIRHWLITFYRRFFAQQFKRSCMPDGIKAGSVCLSPRGDWRMPSDASAKLWLAELENV